MNPYPEKIIDEATSQEFSNPLYIVWNEGYNAREDTYAEDHRIAEAWREQQKYIANGIPSMGSD